MCNLNFASTPNSEFVANRNSEFFQVSWKFQSKTQVSWKIFRDTWEKSRFPGFRLRRNSEFLSVQIAETRNFRIQHLLRHRSCLLDEMIKIIISGVFDLKKITLLLSFSVFPSFQRSGRDLPRSGHFWPFREVVHSVS